MTEHIMRYEVNKRLTVQDERSNYAKKDPVAEDYSESKSSSDSAPDTPQPKTIKINISQKLKLQRVVEDKPIFA
jgi:hypothetical protein